MEERRKLPVKRMEISLAKFNEVAVPHHLDLLRQHKANLIRFQDAGELRKVQNEQRNARRVVAQLRTLMCEMEQLRQQVLDEDISKFDKLTENSRRKALKAIMEYLDERAIKDIPQRKLTAQTPTPSIQSTASSDSIGTVLPSNVQLVVDTTQLEEERIKQKEDCLKGWQELQNDIQGLHDVFVKLDTCINEQKSSVGAISDNVVVSSANVQEGTKSLMQAAKLKVALYPVAGAVIGGCIAGPIGLVAGLKVAGAALIGGSLIGFTGGNFLKNKIADSSADPVPLQVSEDKKNV